MSISTIRQATEKKGCQILLVAIGALLAFGMVATYFTGQNNAEQANAAALAFVIGNTTYTQEQVEAAAQSAVTSGQGLDRSNPIGEFQAIGIGLQQLVAQSVLRQMAAEGNVTVSDQDLLATVRQQVESQMEQLKLQIQLGQNVKPEDVDAKFTELYGKSAQQLVTDQMVQIEEDIKVPAERQKYELAAVADAVQKKYVAQAKVTEEELKQSYDTYTFEQVAFETSTSNTPEIAEKAGKAREELAAGTDPKAVREKYSKGSTYEKTDLTRQTISSTEAYKPLIDLKPGEVSEVLYPFGFPIVYKLINVENKLPADFATIKNQLISQRQQQLGQQAFMDDLQKRREALKIDWKDRGLEMVYKASSLLSDFDLQSKPEEFRTELLALKEEVTEVYAEAINLKYISLAQFVVADQIYNTAPAADKAAALDEWIAALNDVLSTMESVDLRLAATQRLLEAKRNDDAYTMLLDAAKNNRDFEQQGQAWYTQTTQVLEKAKTDKSLTEPQIAEIDAELSAWLDEKVKYDADLAAEREAQQKVQEELDKQNVTSSGTTTGATTGATTGETTGAATGATSSAPTDNTPATTGTTGN